VRRVRHTRRIVADLFRSKPVVAPMITAGTSGGKSGKADNDCQIDFIEPRERFGREGAET
jgi:hypothetical protein